MKVTTSMEVFAHHLNQLEQVCLKTEKSTIIIQKKSKIWKIQLKWIRQLKMWISRNLRWALNNYLWTLTKLKIILKENHLEQMKRKSFIKEVHQPSKKEKSSLIILMGSSWFNQLRLKEHQSTMDHHFKT